MSSRQSSVLIPTGLREQARHLPVPGAPSCTPCKPPTCSPSRTNFLTTARPAGPSPGRAAAACPAVHTKRAAPRPAARTGPTEHMAPGRRGQPRPARGRRTPRPPSPASARAPPAHQRARSPGGTGALGEEKLTCPSRGRKKFGSHPLPPRLRADGLFGARGGRAYALGFVLRTRPRGGGEGKRGKGAGLPPPHRRPPPPTTRPAPGLHVVGRPLPGRPSVSPAGGSALARPARGSRRAQTFFGPPAPRAPLPGPAGE